MKSRLTTRLGSLAVVLLGAGAVGCFPKEFHVGGESTASAENSRLRAEASDLRKEVAGLKDRLSASEQENAALRRRADGRALPAGVVVPMAVTLDFDPISGPVNTDPTASINAEQKGIFDTLRLYVMSYDQMHRLIPVAGTARVRIVAPAKAGKEGDAPQVLAEKTWPQDLFAKTWRDNITGIHFRLEMPLPAELPAKWEAQVEVTDLVTGQVLKTAWRKK